MLAVVFGVMNKRVVFKCSFGGANGWGHVVRCSALANEFLSRGWETCLWSDGDLKSLPREVAAAYVSSTEGGEVAGDLLFVDEMYTEQSVLEGYARVWRKRNDGAVVAGIDDMQRRSMKGFDLVLNSEIGLVEAGYESGIRLLGESFALLRAGFRKPKMLKQDESFDGTTPVLVMMGGTDAFGYLPRVLDALACIDSLKIAPVIVGAGGGDLSNVLKRFTVSRVLNRIDSAELAAWMRFCRVGVIACGSSLYEAAAVELPFVGLSIVDNQTATARKVEANWGMPVLFLEGNCEFSISLSGSLLKLIDRPRVEYSEVDTKGASRVCEKLLEAFF